VNAVRRRLAGRRATVLHLARWETGIVVRRGNPLGFRGAADLCRPGLRLVRREAGSAARLLLESILRRHTGTPVDALEGALEVGGHFEVAHAIALGVADAGIAMRGAALAFGLDFIPLLEERFDLVADSEAVEAEELGRLADTLASAGVRRDLESLGGYDVTRSGEPVAEVAA